ncbi:NAD-glutamate dehydrogenase [Myxococcota bacterium]|nr:NAD-glutamate dehydrogenase [Myxococcota bacterium]
MPKTTIDVSATIRELSGRLSAAAETLVPWFVEQMPASYFENIDEASRLEHLGALVALRAAGQEPRLRIRSADGRRVTYVLPEDAPGTLTKLMRDFGDTSIRAARIHSSRDKQLIIDTFDVGDSARAELERPEALAKFRATLAAASAREAADPSAPRWSEPELRRWFASLTEDYVRECPAERILSNADLCRRVSRSSASEVRLDNARAEHTRITLAVANVSATNMLLRVANRLGTLGIDILRAYVDTMAAPGEEPIVVISLIVLDREGQQISAESALWKRLRADLLRLEWLEDATLDLAYRVPDLELGGADVIATYAELVHQLLVKSNRYAYSRAQIQVILERHLPIAIDLVQLFRERFDPRGPLSEADVKRRADVITRAIEEKVDHDVAEKVFFTFLDAILATKKTNYFVEGRYALSLRLDPHILEGAAPRSQLAHGVFWVHGRGFNAFHLRFRETARGGVRVVLPPTPEQYVQESERHLDEVYELAFAQELKNKDIPEGGAKAVVLVQPGHDATTSVRAFADAVIDLITPEPKTKARVVDLLGNDEWIYFGPDENITPAHIEWIVERAKERGYPFANALMSSKPGAGINHKEFGVTSEGINVFLEVGLNAIGIDPRKQPFSLKLTGGPDGDVAGNEIKIALREFGENVRFVGVADGFGVAEDPRGLDHAELMRLVTESLPISKFDKRRLSPDGKLTLVTDPEGARLRNDMHNRVESDVFVPAGGRPQTINGGNWMRFLGPTGAPASKLIVEGANVFITDEARKKLVEAGVVIIKDSSANKCGVICSSFEVLACLLLSEDEFLEIKPVFVEQVLERLRTVARLEAAQLFQAHAHRPDKPLFELSVMLSREINRITAALAARHAELEAREPGLVRDLVLAYVPPVLREKAGDRVFTKLPATYRAQLVCSSIASRLVYREGLDYLRDVPDAQLAELAVAYVEGERRTHELVDEVMRSNLASKGELAELLRLGGTRAALKRGRA